MNENLRIAVVGATGVVGGEVLSALFDRDFPAERLSVLASERSAGEELEYGEESLEVEKATPESFRGIGLVILATPPEVSRGLAPAAQAAGAWVVDASLAFRADGNVPLVLPGFNSEVLDASFKGRIVSVPSAVTTALVTVLEPLRQAFGVAQVQVTALMGVSSGGQQGLRELESQTAALLSGREPEAHHFPHRVGFNLVPQVGLFMANSPWTEEEAGWTLEAARLFAPKGEVPVVAGTAVQVPTFFGHGLSLHVRLRKPAPVDQARAALKGVARAQGAGFTRREGLPDDEPRHRRPHRPRGPPALLPPVPRVAHPLRRGGQRRPGRRPQPRGGRPAAGRASRLTIWQGRRGARAHLTGSRATFPRKSRERGRVSPGLRLATLPARPCAPFSLSPPCSCRPWRPHKCR